MSRNTSHCSALVYHNKDQPDKKNTKSHLCAVVKLVQRKSACSIDSFDFYSVQNWLGFKEARNERLERLIYIVEKK